MAEARALAGGKNDGFHFARAPAFQMRRRLGISDCSRSHEDRRVKKIEAIIKPFKLDDVKDALHDVGVSGHHRHRSQGLRPPEGPYRALPRRRICDRLPAQGEGRGRGRGFARRQCRRGDRECRAHRPDRRRQDFRASTSSRRSASAPATAERTRSDGSMDERLASMSPDELRSSMRSLGYRTQNDLAQAIGVRARPSACGSRARSACPARSPCCCGCSSRPSAAPTDP